MYRGGEVEETRGRERKAQRTIFFFFLFAFYFYGSSFRAVFLYFCRLGCAFQSFYLYARFFQLVCAFLPTCTCFYSTYTPFSLFPFVFFTSFCHLFFLFCSLPLVFTAISSPLFAAYRFASSPLPFPFLMSSSLVELSLHFFPHCLPSLS